MERYGFEADSYVGSCLMNSEAPIRREFLKFSHEKERNDVKLNNNNSEKVPNTEENSNLKSESKKRKRGTFKPSERSENTAYISKWGNDSHICNNIATIGECIVDSDKHCNKNHDISNYIEFKKNERKNEISSIDHEKECLNDYLNKKCPILEKYGVCYLGLNCEFALNSHFDESNMSNINSNGEKVTSEMLGNFYKQFELNRTGLEIKNSIRRKLVKYPKTSEFLDKILNDLSPLFMSNKVKQNQHKKKNKLQKRFVNPLLSTSLNVCNEINEKSNTEELEVNLKIEKSIIDRFNYIYCTEREKIDSNKNKLFNNKLILAPLTTVGNLPFRRLCIKYGADITVSEMVLCNEILSGKASELALLKRSPDEKFFGIQLACGNKNTLIKTGEFISNNYEFDFIDINAACPVKSLHEKGGGSVLMDREQELGLMIKGLKYVLPKDKLVTVKLRMSHSGSPIDKSIYKSNFLEECENWSTIYKSMKTHKIISILCDSGVDAITIHGRTSFQRYTKEADWDYIKYCSLICNKNCYTYNNNDLSIKSSICPSVIGCGDVLTYEDYEKHIKNDFVDSVMIGRGALLKPWIFTEIKEKRNWDISSNERFEILKQFVDFGLEHWGSDKRGVALTRRFLLEFLSFYHRYIPIGILEQSINSQNFNWRIPRYIGRNDLETLLSSQKVDDWIKISELLLGRAPTKFVFIPKHKSNSY